MCLFGGKIEWMKNFGEKLGSKTFFSVFGWVGSKENKWWGLGIFSLGPPKSFLSKIERKLKRKIRHNFWTKMPCTVGLGLHPCSFSSQPFFFFPYFFHLDVACPCPFFFFFSFHLLGRRCLPFFFFGRVVQPFFFFFSFFFCFFFFFIV